jgi:hypothetical protein
LAKTSPEFLGRGKFMEGEFPLNRAGRNSTVMLKESVTVGVVDKWNVEDLCIL